MKEPDEVACPPSGDENCVSGLIGNVLSLIISILLWLQKVGCSNSGNSSECPNTCELNSALQQLTLFTTKTDEVGASTSGCKPKRLKRDDSKKNLKKSKSGDSRSVMYAADPNMALDPDCQKCCKKLVEAKDNPKGNVIFEVVAAQMAELGTQTEHISLVDNFTQPDEALQIEKDVEAVKSCTCNFTQVSVTNVYEKPPCQDAEVQVDIVIEKELKDEVCECDISAYEGDAEEYEDEEDDEDYNESDEDGYILCPTECLQFSQRRQTPDYHQQPQYHKGQVPIRQDRPLYCPAYSAPPVYKQYNPRYSREPFAPMAFPYEAQPYYQRITRTIQRGPTQSSEENTPQRQKSPTLHPILVHGRVSDPKRTDKHLQSESPQTSEVGTPPPTITLVKPPPTPVASSRASKNENLPQRGLPSNPKECVPNCPGNKAKVVRSSPVPPAPVVPPKSPPPEKDVSKTPSKKCMAKCATSNRNQSNQQKQPPPKEKPRQVALMPKGAIPVEPNDVLHTEEASSKQQGTIPNSAMSVESNKMKK